LISTEHRSLTMELWLSCIFLVAILKGDLWRTRCWMCEWTWVRRRVGACDSFLARIFCVCRCPGWGAAGGVWGRIGEAWQVPETLLCSLWIHLQ
jgi:hypothetical protein